MDINTNVGKNLFAYCGNDAVNYADYYGTCYSPSKARNYAQKWWDGHNPNYKSNENNGGDCANFVSQCLYAGGFSVMTGMVGSDKGWHHYKVFNQFQISDAWGRALELGKWLYNKVGKSNVVKIRKNDKVALKKIKPSWKEFI